MWGIRGERTKSCHSSALQCIERTACKFQGWAQAVPRAEQWGDIRQMLRAAYGCRRVCASTQPRENCGWAKHTQHLLVLCLDPVSTVSLSLKKKPQQIEFSPIQTSLLPPLSSFMAQAPGQLPGCQVPPAHSSPQHRAT